MSSKCSIARLVTLSLGVISTSCASYRHDTYVGLSDNWDTEAYHIYPVVVSDASRTDSMKFVPTLVMKEFDSQSPDAAGWPGPDSILVSADGVPSRCRSVCLGVGEPGNAVRVFESITLVSRPRNLSIARFRVSDSSGQGRDGSNSETLLTSVRYHELLDKGEFRKGLRTLDFSRGIGLDLSYTYGDRVRQFAGTVNLLTHTRSGAWTFKTGIPMLEAIRVDTFYYGNSLFWNPALRLSSILGVLLSPDFEIQRNLTASHSFKVFVGLDITPATNLADSDDSDQNEDDLFDGILYSPRLGAQAKLWAFDVRMFAAMNFWDRFNGRVRDFELGPSLNLTLGSSSEFFSSPLPRACNPAARD